jgi:hypothetical protein
MRLSSFVCVIPTVIVKNEYDFLLSMSMTKQSRILSHSFIQFKSVAPSWWCSTSWCGDDRFGLDGILQINFSHDLFYVVFSWCNLHVLLVERPSRINCSRFNLYKGILIH